LEDTQVETSRFEVEGKRNNVSGFEAFMYGDRDIYRPGETIQLNTIIRTNQWKSVGKIPVKLRILMPNGKEWKSFRLETNDQGAVALSIPTERSNVTGTYILEVLNGNDVILHLETYQLRSLCPTVSKWMSIPANHSTELEKFCRSMPQPPICLVLLPPIAIMKWR
jgi:uncharacterized protein YfaS (alpha-2-macroglobulin family)